MILADSYGFVRVCIEQKLNKNINRNVLKIQQGVQYKSYFMVKKQQDSSLM